MEYLTAGKKAKWYKIAELIFFFMAGNLSCDIRIDGKVQIKGEVTSPEILKTESTTVFEMKVEQLSPVGTFSVCFNLPGPVDTRLASHNFRTDGILEVVVMKFRVPGVATDGSLFHLV